ncbi:FliM/FliN family flagellar motor switch protein [Sphingomonas sp. RIT328]|uniref:FliM/FliN family flagellar motor switch protein n=1 Tax=Sphingomonas sp. RIT328 TaxID=1470591 RepID=UPI0004504EB6|nr:FliM/FliN family flagellar motor switch protein [Sphingomonas sp. RIT328]EZP48698.1 Surface presentation of antigens protein [Sphingomonas sp. RIT328]
MSVLEAVPVQLSIVLGSTQLPVYQVLKMSRGAMIPLDCGQDDPTLVYVDDELVARGRILVEDERMSLEITDIIQKAS